MSIFTEVKSPKVRTSNHNLSEEFKLSCNFGQLIPILCKEVLPSDRFKIETELLIKFAPLKSPMMHRIKAKVDYFFVPNYQLTNVFEKFINPKINTNANPVDLPWLTPHEMTVYTGSALKGSLIDYLGLPIMNSGLSSDTNESLSILPLIAYQHIYNSYYRDQNMEVLENANPATTTLFLKEKYMDIQGNAGQYMEENQLTNLHKLRNCAWQHNYFTSALPSPQAGDDVYLPVGSAISANGAMQFYQEGSSTRPSGTAIFDDSEGTIIDSMGQNAEYENGLQVESTSVSINNLRKLFSLQRFKELAERGGTRYTEMVRNFFGSYLPDSYFDRPVYLGGQVQPINIGEVVSTADTVSGTNGTTIGYRGGIANSYGRTRTVYLNARCHGFVMGMLRILPEATYSQGIERMWTRRSIYDYAWPQFAHLGEQEIRNKELFFSGNPATDNGVFGYTPRYAEYKEGHCHIAGEFRDTLKYWHLGRNFASAPNLNKQFIMMEQMNYDPFYVTSADTEHVYVDLYNHIHTRRPLPYYGTPSGI